MLIALIVLATIGAMASGVYMSGQADGLIKFVVEKYFKAEATAEEKALEKAGETKAEGFLSVDACSRSLKDMQLMSSTGRIDSSRIPLSPTKSSINFQAG